MSAAHLTDPNRLPVLAAQINQAHDLACRSAQAAISHAIAVGGDRTEQHRANLHSAQIAGEMLNVSERTVKTAKHVQEHGAPELVHAVEAGEVSFDDVPRGAA
jgi:hypothetical protein